MTVNVNVNGYLQIGVHAYDCHVVGFVQQSIPMLLVAAELRIASLGLLRSFNR